MRGMSTYAARIPLAATTHRDGRPVPRWASVAAHLVAFTTLPSALWRLPLVFGFSMGALEPSGAPVHVTGWESVYILGLSVVSEAAALLTLGLVKPWGERAPQWFPLIGGRRLRPVGRHRPRRDRRAAARADLGLRVPRLPRTWTSSR